MWWVEQVNSGWLYYMYLAAGVNQFEMKEVCFEFAINASGQGNNVKIKLNLKLICRDCSPHILWNKWQYTREAAIRGVL